MAQFTRVTQCQSDWSFKFEAGAKRNLQNFDIWVQFPSQTHGLWGCLAWPPACHAGISDGFDDRMDRYLLKSLLVSTFVVTSANPPDHDARKKSK